MSLTTTDYLIEQQDWLDVNGIRAMLLRHMNAYIELTGISPSVLGYRATRYTYLYDRLVSGNQSITVETADAVLCYMEFSLTPIQREMYHQLCKEKDNEQSSNSKEGKA